MDIFKPLSYNKRIPTYAGAPIQALDQLGASLEKTYNENKDKSDKLLNGLDALVARDVNQPILNQFKDKIKTRLSALADKGDYENAGNDVNAISREFVNNPTLRGLLEDKTKYDAYIKTIDEKYEKGEISPERYKAAKAYSKKNNSIPIQVNADGTYDNVFNGYVPMKTVDVGKMALDFADKIKASKVPIKFTGADKKEYDMRHDNVTGQYFVTGTKEGFSEDEALSFIASHLQADDKVESYLNEGYLLTTDVNAPVTLEDIAAEMEVSTEAAAEYIKNAGYNPETFTQDQAAMRQLHKNIVNTKEITRIAKPVAGAVSYDKIDLNYHEDKDRARQIEFGNALKMAQYKSALDLDRHKKEKDYDDAKEEAKKLKYVVSNQAKLSGDVEALTTSANLTDLAKQIAEKEKAITQATNMGVSIDPAQNIELQELKSQFNQLKEDEETYVEQTLNNPDVSERFNSLYKRYVKSGGTASKAVFIQAAIDNKSSAADMLNKEGATKGLFGEARLNEIGSTTKIALSFLRSEKDNFVKQSNFVPTTNVLTASYKGSKDTKDYAAAKESNAVDVFTQMMTNSVMNSPTDYHTLNGTPFNEMLAAYADTEKEKDDKFKAEDLNVIMSPIANSIDGKWYVQGRIENSKTGEVLASPLIAVKDTENLKDLYKQLNYDIVKSSSPDSKLYADATIAIDEIELPQVNVKKFNRQLRNVKVGTGIGIAANTEPFTIATQAGAKHFIIEAENVSVPKIVDGRAVNTQIQKRYRIVNVNPTNEGLLDNKNFIKVQNIQNPYALQDAGLLKYVEKSNNKDILTYFNSISEARNYLNNARK